MALIRRDVASDIVICGINKLMKHHDPLTYRVHVARRNPGETNLQRGEGLHGEEPGRPQLKVEAETVEEGPEQHRRAGSQPDDGDPIGAQCCNQLLQHIIMLSPKVIIYIPVKKKQ